MSAKEMFEELGYKLISQDDYSIRYETRTDKTTWISIYFNFLNKTFEKSSRGLAESITLQELQAINKQVEELNWYE